MWAFFKEFSDVLINVFFKSIIILKESEEQVRYSRSDSIMKSEPLFSA